MTETRVGLVGVGLQGRRHAAALQRDPACRLVAVAAQSQGGAADEWPGAVEVTPPELVAEVDLDVVIVATPPGSHRALAMQALTAGRDVLCEKPMAMTSGEAQEMRDCAQEQGRLLWCGFNHRYHPAVAALARRLEDEEVTSLRCLYGIAGQGPASGDWRWQPEAAAGGQLMEQGIHAIDLALWFMPALDELTATMHSPMWGVAGLEEDATVVMRTPDGASATVHSSALQWINTFRLELATGTRCFRIDGLGPSYGEQMLTQVDRVDDGVPFSEHVTHFRGGDRSFGEQWAAFMAARRARMTGEPTDGVERMQAVEAAYRAATSREWVPIA
jgi:predicted dehydrogenase